MLHPSVRCCWLLRTLWGCRRLIVYCFEASIALIDQQKNPLGLTTGIFDLRSEPLLLLPRKHQSLVDDAAKQTLCVLVDIRLENLDATSLRGVFSVLQVSFPYRNCSLIFSLTCGVLIVANYAACLLCLLLLQCFRNSEGSTLSAGALPRAPGCDGYVWRAGSLPWPLDDGPAVYC